MTAPISYPFTDTGVGEALAALGTTANAVATNLSAMGFRGFPGSECACPVAEYLMASVEEAVSAHVYDDGDVFFADVWARGEGRRVSVTADLPLPVRTFVTKFDQLEYPDLIELESDGGAR